MLWYGGFCQIKWTSQVIFIFVIYFSMFHFQAKKYCLMGEVAQTKAFSLFCRNIAAKMHFKCLTGIIPLKKTVIFSGGFELYG